MARTKKSYQYDCSELCQEMALLLESGAAKDIHEAARAVDHKAGGSSWGDARRRRLKRQFRDNESTLKNWARAQLTPPPRSNFKAAVRSMQNGVDHMLWLQRIVRTRLGQERAAEVLAKELERIKREAEQN